MDLEKLRRLNQELLQKLRTNQEEFKRRIEAKPATPSSRPEKNTPQNRRVPDAKNGKENGNWFSKDGLETLMPDFAESQIGAQSPSKTTSSLTQGVGQARASARMPRGPRSILLTPPCNGAKQKAKKEAGHVTFVSNPEERTIPSGDWSIRPFLGYDWIAGLLDMDSSLSEKPEHYFCELQDFRRVNRDECISDRDSPLDGLGSSARDRELDQDPASHQCVFCYRLNKRLFAEPLDPESACPVCKTPRARRPPESLVEPAFVRVSIPRSTLLPAYKHKIHRRKSYEATDNLALPSHCLAGWENPVRAPSPTLSSLDLGSSLDGEPSNQADQGWKGLLRRRPGSFSSSPEEPPAVMLLVLSWLVGYAGVVSLRKDIGGEGGGGGGGGRIHWKNWEPWVCMCDLGKQGRIRHFVVQAANLSLKPKTSEFWQEEPCSLRGCAQCLPEECPDGDGQEGDGVSRRFEAPLSHKPHEVEIPLPPHSDFQTYDSLPVVDDVGDGEA